MVEGCDGEAAVTPIGMVKNYNGAETRPRRWVKLVGLAPPSSLGVFNNSVDVAYKALAERYYLCEVRKGVFEPALGTTLEKLMDPHMTEFLQRVVDKVNLDPVCSTADVVNCYKGSKRARYVAAEQRYYRDGVTKMEAMLRMFVKFEKCDLRKAPRVINPRSLVYNIALGRFLKKNEHKYFDAIAEVFGQDRVVFKGMDVNRSAEEMHDVWETIADPVAIGADAKKFDMHISLEALYYEHLFYIAPYTNCDVLAARRLYDRIIKERKDAMENYQSEAEQLCWLLSQQLNNRGKGYFQNGKVSFKIRGTRSSGDLNTSLGNCILMCAMTWAWKQFTGVRAALVNNGDDCVHVVPRQQEATWRSGLCEYFAEKGFRMELEPTVDQFEEVEFCQSKPCRVANGWRMVRNPATLITKSSMCLKPLFTMNALKKWVMAVGLAEGSLCDGVPVLQSYARALRRNGRHCTKAYIEKNVIGDSSRLMHSNLEVHVAPITDESRVSFCKSWGINPEHQVHLEKYYDSWTLAKEMGERILSGDALRRVRDLTVTVPNLLQPAI